MRRPDAAEVLVGGAALVLAVGDVFLHRNRRRLVTDVLRQPLPAAVLLTLTAHVVDVLGPLDPFRAAAHLIPRSDHDLP